MRPCEVFLRERGVLLGNHGFTPDPGRLETTDSTIVFYHYTRPEKVETVVLDLGYDTTTGHEVGRSGTNSYVPAAEYRGGHLAPEVKATRRGQGIVVRPSTLQ